MTANVRKKKILTSYLNNLFPLEDIVAALKDIVTKEQDVSNIVMCSFVTMSPELMSLRNMSLCCLKPCSSVSHKSLTPLGAPLSVGEGLGVRPCHGSERTKLIH